MSDSTQGNTILDRFDIGIEEDRTEQVLCHRASDLAQPFVIWKRYKGDGEMGEQPYTYSGHYHSELSDAVAQFESMQPVHG